ncbi:MAG: di-heme oxidoredictase family protein [Bacteroidota bacterium]
MRGRGFISISLLGIFLLCLQCAYFTDFSAEELSGGINFTSYNFSKDAFGVQGNNLTRSESRFFQSGNELFRTNWVAAPASVQSLDGLGPLFNANSCGSCHFKDGRGAPPDEPNGTRFGLLWRLNNGVKNQKGASLPHPVYGTQIQDHSIPRAMAEADIVITYDTIQDFYKDGTPYMLFKPNYELTNLAYGEIEENYKLSPRVASQVAGLGLLENIPVESLLANEDVNDGDGDGISGKANYVWNVLEDKKTIGRFGWKANQPTILQQSASAFNGDMGLTSSLFPEDEFNTYQEAQNTPLPEGGYPEISDKQLERITLYVQTLAIPAKRNTDKPQYLKGRTLFYDIGCESCHKASFTTGQNSKIASLNNQKIYPYTDLLLHDMGEDLADGAPDYDATGNEWRTAPLWGLGLIKTVNKHTRLLHDGRARNIEQAILWHSGEAESSKNEFLNLTKKEREDLLFFIESL